jgi:hypothetical protein
MKTGRFVVLLAGVLAGQARGGLLDSPPPALDGGNSRVAYRMGPIQYDPGWADTVITCTNISDAPTRVAVEIFDHGDVRVGQAVSGVVAAGGEVSFVTSTDAGVASANVLQGLSAIDDAKARVSATTSKLSCAGRHRVVAADGTAKEMPVELVKKIAHDE